MILALTVVLALAQAPAPPPPIVPDLKTLLSASNKGDVAEVEKLLAAHPEWVDARDEKGLSFLLNAQYRNRSEVVQAYAKRRTHFDVFEASALGREAALDALIRKDPSSVATYSADGSTPLTLASFFAQEGAVKVLLAHKADVHQYAKAPHVQPLHSAAAGRCVGCVRALLNAGADANASQDGGFRALHEAAANGDQTMAELLIAKGAIADIKNDAGKTSADLARERGHLEIAAWLDSLKK
ncbi:MAG: ankyrin repeat domain-containing protein [Vicinamibacteria bacterium]